MMEQIELMLGQILVADAKAAQRAEAGVDAVNGAGLGGECLYQFAAATNERTGFRSQFAGGLQRSDLPDFLEGEGVPVQLNHADKRRGDLLDDGMGTGKRG